MLFINSRPWKAERGTKCRSQSRIAPTQHRCFDLMVLLLPSANDKTQALRFLSRTRISSTPTASCHLECARRPGNLLSSSSASCKCASICRTIITGIISRGNVHRRHAPSRPILLLVHTHKMTITSASPSSLECSPPSSASHPHLGRCSSLVSLQSPCQRLSTAASSPHPQSCPR